MTISEWADEFRMLPAESAAEAGKWRTSRTEYMRGIMDSVLRPDVSKVTIMSSSQLGKALDVDTPIPTVDGWSTMGELKVGDVVYGSDGQPCTVTYVTGYQYGRECYSVKFSDGSEIIADREHKWQVRDRHDNLWVLTTYDLLQEWEFSAPFSIIRDEFNASGMYRAFEIESIVAVKTRPVKCITVDSKDHLYLAGKQMIPTHNTELILNIVGYFVHYDPSPILVVQPTESMAKTFSRDRLTPMIRDTKALSDLFAASKGRDSSNTILQKNFAGGTLSIIGANSPSQLASRPIRVVLFDEVDRYEETKEGDAVDLATRRTTTFLNRKIVTVSTPNIAGSSRIEQDYLAGNQCIYEVKCHHCNEWFDMQWEYMKWDKNDDGEHLPETAGMECPHCLKRNEQKFKQNQVLNGRWVETAKADTAGHVSFKMGSWLSPFVSYSEIVADFLKSKKNGDSSLRVHVNTFHGEPWQEQGRKIDMEGLFVRRREYTQADHESYHIITVGMDIQDNRAEFEVVGWNRKKQSWSLGYEIVHGDPNFPAFWHDVESRLEKYRFDALAVDTGGHHTKNTYRWIHNNRGRRYYAIKGRGGEGVPIINKPSKVSAAKNATIDLHTLGTDAIKHSMVEMFRVESKDENGYANFSLDLDKEYFLQLTAEKEIKKKSLNGSIKKVWKKIRERNEAFDCRCYAYAAVEILQPNWDFIEQTNDLNKDAQTVDNKEEKEENGINYRSLAIKARRNRNQTI